MEDFLNSLKNKLTMESVVELVEDGKSHKFFMYVNIITVVKHVCPLFHYYKIKNLNIDNNHPNRADFSTIRCLGTLIYKNDETHVHFVLVKHLLLSIISNISQIL